MLNRQNVGGISGSTAINGDNQNTFVFQNAPLAPGVQTHMGFFIQLEKPHVWDTFTINGVPYEWPTLQGSLNTVLVNNGSGNLTWANAGIWVPAWGQFWSTQPQTLVNATTAAAVTFNNSDTGNVGVSVSGSTITFTQAGTYNLQFSLQFANADNQLHDAYVWFRKNNADIAQSNSIFSIPNSHGNVDGHIIAALNLIVTVAATNTVQLMWGADSTQVTINALGTQTGPARPATPSAIFTATQIA